ncbi:MAG TPA: NADH-quinone oxidoreductase subunit N [Syntrophomonadaceae bacterium]|nr:NADH-quinone oxidoreductase subunit N [Syntrophomonadaceae bacterium]
MDITLLSTEILIAVLGLMALVLGLALPQKGKGLVGGFTVVGLVIILINAIYSFGIEAQLFNGVYAIDTFGSFFKVLFIIAAILVILSAKDYTDNFANRRAEFYSFMIFALLGMVIMACANELITLYIGLELMAVSFYILTAYLLSDELSAEAGLKYLILGAISSAILLFGMSLVYAISGTTVISEIAANLVLEPVLVAGVVLLIAGFAFKISLIPFHMWAPDIYQGAPTPVTAFLAVASKAAAFAALLRVFVIGLPMASFDWNFILAILAAITMIAGNLMALRQSNVKRLLAYSSIAQAGYILVGLIAFNVYGLKGVLFYSMLYVFSNIGAFAVATSVEVVEGSTDIKAFSSLGKRSPFMAAIMTVCLLSLAGIPPLAGFVGKFYLFAGVIEAGYLWLAFIGLIMSMISVYYYLNVAKAMYIGDRADISPITPSFSAKIALWTCLAGTILIGVYPAPLTNFVQTAVSIFM